MKKPNIKTKMVEKKYHHVDCPYCGKYMESEYAKQLNWNYKVHIMSCEKNPQKNE